MKNCSWYLWLSGRKIYNIRQLRENFDTALLTGYFLGGSLMKWLSDLGEYPILKRLASIDTGGDIGSQLEFAFGVSPDKRTEPVLPPEITVPAKETGFPEPPVYTSSFINAASSFLFAAVPTAISPGSSFKAAAVGSFSAFSESSFSVLYESSFASIVGNALTARFSSSFSSFNVSSYSAFVTGQALNVSSAYSGSGSSFSLLSAGKWLIFTQGGSFSLSSFAFGSFAYFFGKYGEFTLGSYAGSLNGSYLSWLYALLKAAGYGGSFGSWGSFGDISGFFGEGSFRYNAAGVIITAEEFHRTLINLSSCPLNAYGYGINLI